MNKLLLSLRSIWHVHCFHSRTSRRVINKQCRDATNKPTECPTRLGRVFRLARPSLGIFNIRLRASDEPVQDSTVHRRRGEKPDQPNAHKGSSALFRLGAPSLG